MLCLASFLAVLQGGPVPDPIVVQSGPVVLLDNYDLSQSSNCAGQPANSPCFETLVGIYYPDGAGPKSLGFTNEPKPAWIFLRGGNWNDGPSKLSWFQQNGVLANGFVGIDPSYAVIGPGEDYNTASLGIGRLVQYLRYHSEWLNIDPNRIFIFGRSLGGFLVYAVGLKEDYQDLASPDPMLHESSRPNYLQAFSAPTDLTCLTASGPYGSLMETFFPVSMVPGATTTAKWADSPINWLENPQQYGRDETPPFFLSYALDIVSACGQTNDVHDGFFGKLMWEKILEFADSSNDPELALRSKLHNADDLWAPELNVAEAVSWSKKQLTPLAETMYLFPFLDPLGPSGATKTFKVIGAKPNDFVFYFLGLSEGPVFVPWCPNFQYGFQQFVYLSAALADGEGRAELPLFIPPQAIGIPLRFNAVDFQNCRLSNILYQNWTQ